MSSFMFAPENFPVPLEDTIFLKKMRQGSTLCTALNVCLLKAFYLGGMQVYWPHCACQILLGRHLHEYSIQKCFCLNCYCTLHHKGHGHLLFYSAASAHIASPSEQAGTGVGSDLAFLGLPLSSSLTWGPFLGLRALVCFLKNRWKTLVEIRSAIPSKWCRVGLDQHKVLLTSLEDWVLQTQSCALCTLPPPQCFL